MSNADLIARLEKAESGSREFDSEMSAFSPPVACACSGHCNPTQANYEGCCIAVPRYTTSLDAIVALIGEKLPDVNLELYIRPEKAMAELWYAEVYRSEAKTAPLALCIALLRALDQNGGGHG